MFNLSLDIYLFTQKFFDSVTIDGVLNRAKHIFKSLHNKNSGQVKS